MTSFDDDYEDDIPLIVEGYIDSSFVDDEEEAEWIESGVLDQNGDMIVYKKEARKPKYTGFLAYDAKGNLVPRHKVYE